MWLRGNRLVSQQTTLNHYITDLHFAYMTNEISVRFAASRLTLSGEGAQSGEVAGY